MLEKTTGLGGEWEKIPLTLISTRFCSLNSPFAQSSLIFETADSQHNCSRGPWGTTDLSNQFCCLFNCFSLSQFSAKQVKKQLLKNSFLNFFSMELCGSLSLGLPQVQGITLYAPYVAMAQIRIIRREIAVAMHISGKETRHISDCRQIQSLVQLFCYLPCAEHLKGQGGKWGEMGSGALFRQCWRKSLPFVGTS